MKRANREFDAGFVAYRNGLNVDRIPNAYLSKPKKIHSFITGWWEARRIYNSITSSVPVRSAENVAFNAGYSQPFGVLSTEISLIPESGDVRNAYEMGQYAGKSFLKYALQLDKLPTL